MRRASVVIGLLTIWTSVACGDVTFHLYASGTTHSTLDVAPGGTAELWVRLYADAGEQVTGARYDVQLPMEGWTLTSREYSDYGWYEEDGLWDGGVPLPSATPVVISNDTYIGGAANTADFWFNTIRSPYPSSVTGWATCEVFEITVPQGTPLATYPINLANTYAYDVEGIDFTTSGGSLDLTVTPEPASTLLVLAGITILGARLRRRV